MEKVDIFPKVTHLISSRAAHGTLLCMTAKPVLLTLLPTPFSLKCEK